MRASTITAAGGAYIADNLFYVIFDYTAKYNQKYTIIHLIGTQRFKEYPIRFYYES